MESVQIQEMDEEVLLEREFNLLFEMTLRMEHELLLVTRMGEQD